MPVRPAATRPTPLSARGLRIGYLRPNVSDHVLASGLELELGAGELVCLLGPNGAGKSTLLRTLAGMQPALAGEVHVFGRDVGDWRPRQLARRLAVVLTDRLPPGLLTVAELVALGRHPHTPWTGRLDGDDRRQVAAALETVGAGSLAHRPVAELSDGERQRVMVARALAQEADVLVLDEVTAFLDLPRRLEVMGLLRQLAHDAGKAVLLSTHDLDLALRNADRLWLIDGGRMRTGVPESLVLDGSLGRTFAVEGVDFDPASGAFRLRRAIRGEVALEGSGLAAVWTGRALERLGLRPVSAGAALPRIRVRETPAGTSWQLCGDDGRRRDHGDLESLLAALGH